MPDPFKIPHGWMEKYERIAFWPILSYPDIFNFLMFYPSELGSKELRDFFVLLLFFFFNCRKSSIIYFEKQKDILGEFLSFLIFWEKNWVQTTFALFVKVNKFFFEKYE